MRVFRQKALRRILCFCLCLCLTLGLAGCAGLAPVYTIGERSPGNYVVKKGDTLYSIAFRYGLDYKSLARINSIGPPYTIYVNQVIGLKGSSRAPKTDRGPVSSSAKKKEQGARPKTTVAISGWRWPLSGEIVSPFSLSSPVNKGIDIAASHGDPVRAAADGVVVYAGGNLRGYGKLVIVKHNANFLSAYGNNDAMLVREGERVKAGKTIARVGRSSAHPGMLHFEIRRDGKPEDPVKYLPTTTE